jgi:tetratricopeptide (TPR) repeat protein
MRHALLIALCATLPWTSCAAPSGAAPRDAADGWSLLELGDDLGALQLFERELQRGPDAALFAGRGQALCRLGRLDDARASYERAVALEPTEGRARIGLSAVQLAQGDVAGALATCDAAIALDPGLERAFYNRGCAHLADGRDEQAIADFTRALQLEPAHARALDNRGAALARLGRLDEAVADFQEALRLEPLSEAHGNCAAACYALGDTKRALKELNAALRIERSNPIYHANRGRIYLDLGELALALADFEAAAALAPDDADALGGLAAVRARQADVRAAALRD